MRTNHRRGRALRLIAPWVGLALWLACGGNSDDDSTPEAEGPFTIRPGFVPDPRTATGEVTGNIAASTIGGDQCRGHVTSNNPDHTIDARAAFTNLRVIVSSEVDTTLMIRMADGTFRCNDDAEGFNPIVQGPFPAGTHQVYVGTYSAGRTASYNFGVTELSSTTAASLGTPAGAAGAGAAAGGGGGGGGVCGRAAECCEAYMGMMNQDTAVCANYRNLTGTPGEGGCSSAIQGWRTGLTAMGRDVPAPCQE